MAEGTARWRQVAAGVDIAPAMRGMISLPPIEISGQTVTRIEFRGQQVVTFAMIDRLHGRPDDTAKKRFNDNRDRFVDGEDFYLIKRSEKSEIRTFGIDVPNRGLTLITRRGYLKIVKSLNDHWRRRSTMMPSDLEFQ